MFLKFFITLCALIVAINCDDCDISKCQPVPKHYKELGCTQVIDEGKCCPSRFECPKFAERDNTKCYYKGKIYDEHEMLPKNVTGVACIVACTCADGFGGNNRAGFICAQKDCANWFNPLQKECIPVYDTDFCCPSKHICEEDEKSKLATCYLDGQEYREGQKMYPKDNSCYTCQCKHGFDNTTIIGNSNCVEVNCGIELHNLDKIVSGCIPMYFGKKCCPIDWKCPNEEDQLIKNKNRQIDVNEDANNTCKYGDKILNVGDSISDSKKCVECKCLVPPMVHCVQQSYEC